MTFNEKQTTSNITAKNRRVNVSNIHKNVSNVIQIKKNRLSTR